MLNEDYPLFGYVYDSNGFYREPVRLTDKETVEKFMRGPVTLALAEKREVVITDTGDLTVFHCKDGAILYPTVQDLKDAGITNESKPS